MTVFLVVQLVRKTSEFRHGFFVLYVSVSTADCMYIAHSYLFVRLPHNGFFTESYANCRLCPKIAYEWSGYFSYAQVLGHIAIACNRFTVFFTPRLHSRLWSGPPLTATVVALLLVPLGMISYRFPGHVDYVWSSGRIVNEAYRNEDIQKTVPIVGGCLYIAAGVLCGILNLSAALRYRLQIKTNSLPRSVSNQDVRLLVHSILLLCFLLFRAVYHAIVFLSSDAGDAPLAATALSFLPAVTDGYSLLGSVFLVSISTPVREGYVRFYKLKRSNVVTKVFSVHETTLHRRA